MDFLGAAQLAAQAALALYNYAQKVHDVDNQLLSLRKNVNSTSAVIPDLEAIFKEASDAGLLNADGVRSTQQMVAESKTLFKDIIAILEKTKKSSIGIWKFPFKEGQIEDVHKNLDRLHNKLQLRMTVLIYKHQQAAMINLQVDMAAHKACIVGLKKAGQYSSKPAGDGATGSKDPPSDASAPSDRPCQSANGTGTPGTADQLTYKDLATCVSQINRILFQIEESQRTLRVNHYSSSTPTDASALAETYLSARQALDGIFGAKPSDVTISTPPAPIPTSPHSPSTTPDPVVGCRQCHHRNRVCDGKTPVCTPCKKNGKEKECAAEYEFDKRRRAKGPNVSSRDRKDTGMRPQRLQVNLHEAKASSDTEVDRKSKGGKEREYEASSKDRVPARYVSEATKETVKTAEQEEEALVEEELRMWTTPL